MLKEFVEMLKTLVYVILYINLVQLCNNANSQSIFSNSLQCSKNKPHQRSALFFTIVCWSALGLQDIDGHDSTLWVGSKGASTPCHYDSYGFNLVAQIQGRSVLEFTCF